MSDLRTLQRNWEEAAIADPLWAILSAPGKDHRRWDLEEFLASGRAEIAGVLEYLAEFDLPTRRDRALDFGCGVGRLTQALAEHFVAVDGVDVASGMIERAHELNRHGERCRYHVNAEPHLRLFPDDAFDLVYSNLVLQHVGPELACGYILEFVRVLAPEGVALFQLPSEPTTPETRSSTPRALPDDAFRARLTPAPDRIQGRPGSRILLPVRVRNESPHPWPVAGSPDGHDAINLGNHWRTRRGRLVALDDGRCPLPGALPPGEEIELLLGVTLPDRPGTYLLEVDMVQEHVSWFAARGSRTARLRASVERPGGRLRRGGVAAEAAPIAEQWSRAALSMDGVPKERVLALLEGRGARVLDVQEDRAAGSGWISLRYAVVKEAAARTRAERPG
jgi:SAM-dependent methyltransferase